MGSERSRTEESYLFQPLMETPERYFPMMLEKTLEEPSNIYDLTYGFLGTEVGSLNVRDLERNKRMLIYELLDYFCQQSQPEFTLYFVSLLPNLEELMAGLAEEQAQELELFGAEVFERMVMPRERLLEKVVELLGKSGDGRAIEPLHKIRSQAKSILLEKLSDEIERALKNFEAMC